MKTIPLTQGLHALVDDSDYDRLIKWKWYAHQNKIARKVYAARGIKRPGKQVQVIFMHRVILNVKKHKDVDHKDDNGLNNQRFNIRACSRSQNSCNQKLACNNTSGIKGVSFRKDRRQTQWQSRITKNGKTHHLGFFDSKPDAKDAYNQAAKKLHKEFAKLNPL